jgi:aminomethyltransferase
MAHSWESPIAVHCDIKQAPATYDGCATPAQFSSVKEEYHHLRQGIGLVDQSHCGKFRVAGSSALDLLNRLSLADLTRVAINRMMASYMLHPDGTILCDLYAVNRGDSYLLFTQGREPGQILEVLHEEGRAFSGTASVTNLTQETALLGVQGPFAWELMKDLLGIRILGTRFQEVMTGEKIGPIPVTVYRGGKTAEFAYLLEVDAGDAQGLWQTLLDAGKPYDLIPCGIEAQDICSLEDRIVNTRREGALAENVLELNCRIMVSRDKGDYIGREAVERAIEQGLRRRLVGICMQSMDGPEMRALDVGAVLQYQGAPIGTVANAGFSYTLGKEIGVAFLDVAYAYAGLDYEVRTGNGTMPVRTVSAPFVLNRSFTIRPQEDSYLDGK